MMLLTKEIQKSIPELYAQDGLGEEAKIYVKFFTPWSNWTWYATEASGILADEDGNECYFSLKDGDLKDFDDVMFFGLVVGQASEKGYFLLSDFEKHKGPAGLMIERDRHFNGYKIGDVEAGRVS